MIYSATSEINAIELSTLRRVHLVSNLKRAVALEVHVRERTFYWSDINLHVIKRMNMSSGIVEDIVTGDLGSVEGLAVEWEGNVIYWTDYTYSRIEVASVDGSNRKLLFKEEIGNPRGIALYPKKGWVFIYYQVKVLVINVFLLIYSCVIFHTTPRKTISVMQKVCLSNS